MLQCGSVGFPQETLMVVRCGGCIGDCSDVGARGDDCGALALGCSL